MPRPHPILLLLLLRLSAADANSALSCSDHPAYRATYTPPLLRSFDLLPRPSIFQRAVYLPRLRTFNYHPVSDNASTTYANLDLFFSAGTSNVDRSAVLHLNRPALVYLFVGFTAANFRANRDAKPRLPGYTFHELVQLPDPRWTERLLYGVHQEGRIAMQKYNMVFSRPSAPGDVFEVPARAWIKKNLQAPFPTEAGFVVRLAEKNGAASQPVGTFQGLEIEPNTRCPDALHDAWAVPDSNRADEDTKGRLFGSWHPQWDPCFWCAYDHEHGSSPAHLMGYTPKYGYTAFKNAREDEEDPGHKGFVFQVGDYMVYFNIHVQTSSLRRVTESYHTIAFAVTDAKSGELQLELQHKGNFGFLAARGLGGGFVALSREDEIEQRRQEDKYVRRQFRTVNVVDVNNLDKRFRYRSDNPITGVYEEWVTFPICADAPPNSGVVVDVKTPITGIRSYNRMDEKVRLTRATRNLGLARSARFREITLAAEHCVFDNSNETVSGYFYTNARGDKLLNGPGRDAVLQYIKPGFSITLRGMIGVVEQWLGLHRQAVGGNFFDHGYGLDPEVN